MALVSIGAVTLNHGDPKFVWDSSPDSYGNRPATMTGSCSWVAVKQLSELAANPIHTTIGAVTGVREDIVFSDSLLAEFTGAYLITGFSFSADQKQSLTSTDVPFSLSAVFLGPHAP